MTNLNLTPPTCQVAIEDFYPYSYTPRPRYGEGQAPHPLIEKILSAGAPNYEARLRAYLRFLPDLLRIGLHPNPQSPDEPCWNNAFLPGLDALVLYAMIADGKPATYCEIGSGHSTRFAHLARRQHSTRTRFVLIDPAPRADVAAIADHFVPSPLQACEPKFFSQLDVGDILFIDGSHRVLQNSDVSVFFLEILPTLKPGVIIHLHDVFWPFDYPSAWARRMYSEQYMLGTLLLFGEQQFDVLMPNAYISATPPLCSIFAPLWEASHLQGIAAHGGSFWFTKRPS